MNAKYPHGTNPSGQESVQDWLNLGLTPGSDQSLYVTQHQHMGAEYHQGTNPSDQTGKKGKVIKNVEK
ncbi:unnamed protein product [Meloidogyne enterolobii]|uniref:Uncharacterized protein n=1 Tax=Meloidogyne enterolobii TaxID=390850 RepID=A0ACB0YAS5_MELEN